MWDWLSTALIIEVLPMNILITGSSGMIGANLALRLLGEGNTVLGIDCRNNQWTDRIPFRKVDLRKNCVGHLVELIKGFHIDIVVHLAAHAKVYELVIEPSRALENVDITFKVLESARLSEVPIIFGSSREVYGDIHRHVTNESSADFVVAESPYSASKISGEAFIYSFAQCYGLPYVVFRFSNVYGRYDSDLERMERVTPLFIRRISRGEPITIFGKEKILDFTYIDDCIQGMCLGIRKLSAGEVRNQTINLAYSQGHSLDQLAMCIGESLRVEPVISYAPSQCGEVTRYVADISKARDLLGYQPTIALREGIRKAIAWQREFGVLPS